MAKLCSHPLSWAFVFVVVGHVRAAGPVAHSSLFDSVLDELKVRFPNRPQSILTGVAQKSLQSALSSESLSMDLLTCDIDFDGACPEGWSDIGDGNTCEAPSHYAGNCGPALQFGVLSPLEKMQLSTQCALKLPCRGHCVQNFTQTCPMGWHLDEGASCVAPEGYSGACSGRKRFHGLAVSEKADWGAACAAAWPCRKEAGTTKEPSVNCEEDFSSAACPSGWRAHGDICVAPPTYRGKCALSFAPSQYTPKMKQEWSRSCEAPWPCK